MFDARKFLDCELGAPQAIIPIFNLYGVEPPKAAAVEKWYSRRSVPADWFAKILCILELDRGEPVRLAPYIKEK